MFCSVVLDDISYGDTTGLFNPTILYPSITSGVLIIVGLFIAVIVNLNRRIKLLSEQLALNQSPPQRADNQFLSVENNEPVSENSDQRPEVIPVYEDVWDVTPERLSTQLYLEPTDNGSFHKSDYTGLRDEIQRLDIREYAILGRNSAAIGNLKQLPDRQQTEDMNVYQLLLRSRINEADYSIITNEIRDGVGHRDIDNTQDYSELRAEIESRDVHECSDLRQDTIELATLAENDTVVSTNDYQHLRRSRMTESEYSAVPWSDS